jgi:predicted nucleic acid-binding protein
VLIPRPYTDKSSRKGGTPKQRSLLPKIASSDGGRPASRRLAQRLRTHIRWCQRASAGAGDRPAGPRPTERREQLTQYDAAVAALADALNEPKRAIIGDVREGVYKVAFTTHAGSEARELAKQLARIGIIPRTYIDHDRLGEPISFEVAIWEKADQRHLLNTTSTRLAPGAREQLNDLVLARGPIPDDLLERIWNAHHRGMTPARQADELNELKIITGMGGKRWTAQKVRKAVAEYERRHGQHQEAA